MSSPIIFLFLFLLIFYLQQRRLTKRIKDLDFRIRKLSIKIQEQINIIRHD